MALVLDRPSGFGTHFTTVKRVNNTAQSDNSSRFCSRSAMLTNFKKQFVVEESTTLMQRTLKSKVVEIIYATWLHLNPLDHNEVEIV